MSVSRLPESLVRALERDPAPVRPVLPPARRALAMLPLGIALVVGVPLLWGWRENLSQLGVLASWGVSFLLTAVGLALIGLALREAIPGRELSTRAVVATSLAALALFLALTWAGARLLPTAVPPEHFLPWIGKCFAVTTLTALPALAVAAWLVARALPNRPALTGALYGVGAGLLADAGMHLFCRITSPSHVLISHGGAILAAGALSALSALAMDRLREWRRRRDDVDDPSEQ